MAQYKTITIRIDGKNADGVYPVELADDTPLARSTLTLPTNIHTSQNMGLELGQALFSDGVLGRQFGNVLFSTRDSGKKLRVRLMINAPELAPLLWEQLHWPDTRNWRHDWQPLATNAEFPLSRVVLGRSRPVRQIEQLPLRVLVIVASPSNGSAIGLAPIRDEDVDALNQAFAQHEDGKPLYQATWLHSRASDTMRPTVSNIQRQLQGNYDAVHILAHGRSQAGQTVIYLEKADGRFDKVKSAELVNLFAELNDKPPLVFLGTCESGTGSVALGPSLVQDGGVEAVIGMNRPITMHTNSAFTSRFYAQLAKTGIVDLATNEARSACKDKPDWAVPLLFMRTNSGKIWQQKQSEPPPPPPPHSSPQSGGIQLNVGGNITIGGDVIGGDKVVHNGPGSAATDPRAMSQLFQDMYQAAQTSGHNDMVEWIEDMEHYMRLNSYEDVESFLLVIKQSTPAIAAIAIRRMQQGLFGPKYQKMAVDIGLER